MGAPLGSDTDENTRKSLPQNHEAGLQKDIPRDKVVGSGQRQGRKENRTPMIWHPVLIGI
jgi:hypothetical protein